MVGGLHIAQVADSHHPLGRPGQVGWVDDADRPEQRLVAVLQGVAGVAAGGLRGAYAFGPEQPMELDLEVIQSDMPGTYGPA